MVDERYTGAAEAPAGAARITASDPTEPEEEESDLQPTDIKDPDYFHRVVDCQWACPAHTPVPEYIRLIADGRYADAFMIIWKPRTALSYGRFLPSARIARISCITCSDIICRLKSF